MKDIIFSIIVVFKNEERGLPETLNGISKQRFPKEKYELVCVDDGSTDNSFQIAKIYTSNVIRFEKSVGISNARNAGIRKSKGEILLFLDGHMVFGNNLLNKFLEEFKKNPSIKGVCGSYKSKINNDWNILRDIRRKAIFKKSDEDRLISIDKFTTFSSAVGALYKKQVVNAGFFPDGFKDSAGEDTLLQIKLHNEGYTLLYTPKIKAYHDAHIGKEDLLLNKLVKEVRSTGNILIAGKKDSLKVPYLNYFLSFPLLFIIFFFLYIIFRNPLFLILLGIDLSNYVLRLAPIMFMKEESIKNRLSSLGYLISGETFKLFYLPYYLFIKKRSYSKSFYFLKTMIMWEYLKWKNLFF